MQGGRCCYCEAALDGASAWGDLYATIEHIEDRARGGVNAQTNLAMACRGCNDRANTEKWSKAFKCAKIQSANIIAIADLTVEHMELPPLYLAQVGGAA